jgi:hypothetical protein
MKVETRHMGHPKNLFCTAHYHTPKELPLASPLAVKAVPDPSHGFNVDGFKFSAIAHTDGAERGALLWKDCGDNNAGVAKEVSRTNRTNKTTLCCSLEPMHEHAM